MRFLSTVLVVLVVAASALADDDDDGVLDFSDPRCAVYVPAKLDQTARSWNQVLSFAGCVQDSAIVRFDAGDDLADGVAKLAKQLAPAMALYFAAIQHGPSSVQLRAAYEVGMAHVALVTRARSSIHPPADLRTNAAAARHYRELHERLEPALAQYAETAWLVFSTIDRAAKADPALASDPVARYMIDTSQRMLVMLADHAPAQVGTSDAASGKHR
jgi:hypothetical protein